MAGVADDNTPRPLRRTVADLKALTPARIGLGRSGASLTTRALLDFTLDHARARDAVHSSFDTEAIAHALVALGLETVVLSRALARADYLKRPISAASSMKHRKFNLRHATPRPATSP